MVVPWYMELPFNKQPDPLSRELLLKVRRFYMQQLELSQALLQAKPLGICKITTSGRNPTIGIPHGGPLERFTPSKNDLKETSL